MLNETFWVIFNHCVLFPKQIFCLSHLFSFFRLKRLSPKMATIIVRVPDMISKTGTTRKSWEAKVKRCRRKIPMAIDPEATVMAPNAINRILVISRRRDRPELPLMVFILSAKGRKCHIKHGNFRICCENCVDSTQISLIEQLAIHTILLDGFLMFFKR